MCGIVGLLSKNSNGFSRNHQDLFKAMLQMDTIRGPDSTGIFGVDKEGRVDIVKGDTNGYTFTSAANYVDIDKKILYNYRIIIGHNRKATRGEITPHNAHPFKEDHITLVHNGFIQNANVLNDKVAVDSHAIASELAKGHAVEAIEKLNGAFAIVWYDQTNKTLNLARNKERPLWVLEFPDYWCISSEVGLAKWLTSRFDPAQAIAIKELTPETILTFSLSDLEKEPVESTFIEYSYPVYEPVNKPWLNSWVNRAPVVSNDTNRPSSLMEYWNKAEYPPSITNQSGKIFARGDTITVRFTECKETTKDTKFQLLGHPVFNNGTEQDENILIKCPSNNNFDSDIIYKHDLFTGKIMSITHLNGVPIIYVNTWSLQPVVPPLLLNPPDANADRESMIHAGLKEKCSKCAVVVTADEIDSSMFKRRSNGAWRILCPKCYQDTIQLANQMKAEREIRGVHLVN